MAHLTTLPATADTAAILPIIEKDGAVILKDMLTPAEVDRVLSETEPYIEATRNGQDPFVGLRTTRTGALVARSRGVSRPGNQSVGAQSCPDLSGTLLLPHSTPSRPDYPYPARPTQADDPP